MDNIGISKLLRSYSNLNGTPSGQTSQVKTEKIVDYPFEKNEKSNVLAIHPTKPLIAYLITIQRGRVSKAAWSGSADPNVSAQNCSNSSNSSLLATDQNKTVSIRIIDYQTRQKCLARGIYHARPAACAFTINSLICSQTNIVKLAVVDRLSNVYIYDLSYSNEELVSTRVLVVRSSLTNDSPSNSINLVWCPYVPCEDFDDGDGGLRLALSTNTNIEIFAIDRLNGKTGELQRNELKGAYKSLKNAHSSKIISLNISPDCSTISAAAEDNKVRFFPADIDDTSQLCLHNWEAKSVDGCIAKLFFLDDLMKLLEDSNMKFWGSVFLATRLGQIILIDLRTWTIYQSISLKYEGMLAKDFDYQIDFTSKCIIAISGQNCFVVQIQHNESEGSSSSTSLPKITKVTQFPLHSPVYSYVTKHRSSDEVDLFTISAVSLERFTINLNAMSNDSLSNVLNNQIQSKPQQSDIDLKQTLSTPNELQTLFQQFGTGIRISSSATNNSNTVGVEKSLLNNSLPKASESCVSVPTLAIDRSINASPSVSPPKAKNLLTQPTPLPPKQHQSQHKPAPVIPSNALVMDKMVESLFSKLNCAFSQGLGEFLADVKSEVNDLKMKINGLNKEVRRLQLQIQESKTR